MFRDTKTMMFHSRRLTDSYDDSNFLYPVEESLEETNTLSFEETKLSRTPVLLLDYIQFLAARTIQQVWRGYSSRKATNKTSKAAITIQRWWRGYSARKNYTRYVEQKLQDALMDYYNKAATKIQALFRGWWSRHTYHDMNALTAMQSCAAEDLLNCVAYKLHHLLRTQSIPGVYSLRNSTCLSRVEKLLVSIHFRFHNGRVFTNLMNRQDNLRKQSRNFDEAKHYTNVPYSGPNYKGACRPHCEDLLHTTKDVDKYMFKIISAYDEAQREKVVKKTHYNLTERKRRRKIEKLLKEKAKHHCNFCTEVIASMRRWNIWDKSDLIIPNDIFRHPENLENFFAEAANIMDDVQGQCHCNINVYDSLVCH